MTPLQIKELRLKMELNQQQFSNLIGVGINTVCKWEKGKSRPHVGFMIKLRNLAHAQH